MNRSGIKNVVLILLLLVNFAAAAVLIHRAVAESAAAADLSAAAVAYMEKCGVTVADGVISGRSKSYEIVQLAPDADQVAAIATALIGPAERRDAGIGDAEFVGEGGSCRLGADGEIEAVLSSPGLELDSPTSVRRQVLRLLGDALDLSSATAEVQEADDGYAITIRDTLAEISIENGELAAQLRQDGSLTLQGYWRMGAVSAELTSGQLVQASAVAKYIGSLDGEIPFSEITAIRQVYWLYPEATGELSIIPAYRLETDRGEIVVDAISAKRLK